MTPHLNFPQSVEPPYRPPVTNMAVDPQLRFRRNGLHCPICGGYEELPHGQGTRCWGYQSKDGKWAHCMRAEYAGTLVQGSKDQAYHHRIDGSCKCGILHAPPTVFLNYPADVHPLESHTHHSGYDGSNHKHQIIKTYDYRDRTGVLVHQTVRFEPKGFSQRRPDGFGGWFWNLQGIQRVLYRLPELQALPKGSQVFIPEGEKDVDTLVSFGLAATTNAMGAKNWRGSYSDYLRGHHVVILPDADKDGALHAAQVARSSHSLAASVKVVALPGAKDISEWIGQGHTREELLALVEAAPAWSPPPVAVPLDAGSPPVQQQDSQEDFEERQRWIRRMWRRRAAFEHLLMRPPMNKRDVEFSVYGLDAQLYGKLDILNWATPWQLSLSWEEMTDQAPRQMENFDPGRRARIDACLRFYGNFCVSDGLRAPGRHVCNDPLHDACLSSSGETLSRANVKDAGEGEIYHLLIFQWVFGLPGYNPSAPEQDYLDEAKAKIGNEASAWIKVVWDLSRRKRFKKGLQAKNWNVSLNVGLPGVVYGTLVYKTTDGDTSQAPIEEVKQEVQEALKAKGSDAAVFADLPIHTGSALAEHLMVISRTWFTKSEFNSPLLEAAMMALRSRHLFQSYNELREAMRLEDAALEAEEAKKEPFEKEAPHGRCNVCKKPLFQADAPEGVDTHDLPIGAKPGWASTFWAREERTKEAWAKTATIGESENKERQLRW